MLHGKIMHAVMVDGAGLWETMCVVIVDGDGLITGVG